MKIVDIDGVYAEVTQAAPKLVLQIPWRHAVTASDDVLRAKHSRLEIFSEEILVWIGWHRPIRRQIAAFRAKNQLLARNAFRGELLDRGADAALAPLEAVVDRRVNDVDSALSCRNHRRRVALVGFRVRLTEVRADAQRRKKQSVRFAEMPRGGFSGKSLCVPAGGTPRCRAFSHPAVPPPPPLIIPCGRLATPPLL